MRAILRQALGQAEAWDQLPRNVAKLTKPPKGKRRRAQILSSAQAGVLMAGINTGPEEARELGRLFQGVPVRLSVIDYNSTPGAPEFQRADDEERRRFLGALAENGIGFVRRYSGGPDIDAACGLLASRARGGQAMPGSRSE